MSEYNSIEEKKEEKKERKRKDQYKRIKKSRKQQAKIEKTIKEKEPEEVSRRIDSEIKKIESVIEPLPLKEKQIIKENSSEIIPFHSGKRKEGEKKTKKIKKKRKKEKKDISRKPVVYTLSKQEKQRLLENAIDKLSQDIKLLFLALFNVYKNTSPTAIKKSDNRYTKKGLFRDAFEYVQLKFPYLKSEEFESLWQEFLRIFEKGAKYDVLIGFNKNEGSFQEKEKSLIYEKHKNAILEEIYGRINNLNDFEKKIVYLFLNLRDTLSFLYVDSIQLSITEFKKQFNLIFDGFISINPYKLLIKLGLLFCSTWISTNENKNNSYLGYSYKLPDYLEEISNDIILRLLKEVEIPDFSESLQNLKNKFDISNNIAVIIQYVALDYILNNPNRLSDLNAFLNNVRVDGPKKFLDFPRINKNITLNYLLREKIHHLIHETKIELLNSFKWLINFLREKFNLWDSDILKIDEIEYGKEFSLEVNGNQYYIWLLYWYNEEILNRLNLSNPNTIVIFLYHPKFKFLQRNIFNPEIMHGIISFGENNNVFTIGPKKFYQNLIQLFQLLDKKRDKRISIISPKEIEEYDEEYDEIDEYDKDIISQILKPKGKDGGKSSGGDDFWDIFEWDAETWKNFHLSGINSKKPLCIFLKAKTKNFFADETIIKLISSEYKRKYGKLEAKHDIESISELDTITIIPENIVENLIDGLNIKKNKTISSLGKNENIKIFENFLKELTDLMGQLDSTISGGEKKLIIFRCNYDSSISDLFNKVTSILPNTHILKIKYDTFTEEIIQRIMNQLCWVLSLPRYNWRKEFLEVPNNLIDINAIYTELERTNEKFYDDFGNEDDMNYIEKSWNGESDQHFNLKLPVYKYLKKYIEKKYDLGADLIRIEKRSEIDGDESEVEGVEPNTNESNQPIPDLYVENKIWVEIETLLGFPDPRLLINEKFKPKKESIEKCDEFWLVIPNFEIFMNKEKIKILLRRLFLLLSEEVIIKIFSIDYERKTLKPWISKRPKTSV